MSSLTVSWHVPSLPSTSLPFQLPFLEDFLFVFLSLFVPAVRFPSRSARAFSMHLGFSPAPSSFSCNPLTSIFQIFSIHFHSPFPSFPHTSLTGVDSTPIDCIIRSNVRHGCSIVAPCCNPFSIHSINAFSINCPHIFHFPPFPAFVSSTPLHVHQFCIFFVHPFSSPSHELFIRIPFPFRSPCPVPFTFCPCIFLHLGFSPMPSSFACNSFDFHSVHFQSLLFPCISPSAPCFASPACIASSASSGMMLAMLGV